MYYIQSNIVAANYFGAIQQLPIITTVAPGMKLM
jgi:hypothetical protein